MPVKRLAAATAYGLPPALGHIGLTAPSGTCADFDAFHRPDLVVTVARADQGVRYLVQDGVLDLFDRIVPFHEVDGKLDGPAVVDAQPHRLLAAVEGEGPIVQPMFGHE